MLPIDYLIGPSHVAICIWQYFFAKLNWRNSEGSECSKMSKGVKTYNWTEKKIFKPARIIISKMPKSSIKYHNSKKRLIVQQKRQKNYKTNRYKFYLAFLAYNAHCIFDGISAVLFYKFAILFFWKFFQFHILIAINYLCKIA